MQRYSRFLKVLVGLLAVCLLLAGTASSQEDTRIRVVGGDDAEIRTFVERFIFRASPYSYDLDSTIYIAALPPELPFTLPLPADAVVVGSLARGEDNPFPAPDEILLDVPMPAADALTIIADNLGEGFEESDLSTMYGPAPSGGFGANIMPSRFFCYNEEELGLYISAYEDVDGISQVFINILDTPEMLVPCTLEAGERLNEGFITATLDLIPLLEQPEGVRVRAQPFGGGGYSDFHAESAALLEPGDNTLAELFALYNIQLSAAQWTMHASLAGEGAAVSVWTFADERGNAWNGQMVLVEYPPAEGDVMEFSARISVIRVR